VGRREAYVAGRPILAYFDLGSIRGSTSDEVQTIFSGDVYIGYDEDRKEIGDDLVRRRRQISNAIMIRLSRKTFQDLRADRLEQIQEELAVVVNGVLSAGRVQEVLLDNFTAVR
jgi:flagellar basal body-associated protein FliL